MSKKNWENLIKEAKLKIAKVQIFEQLLNKSILSEFQVDEEIKSEIENEIKEFLASQLKKILDGAAHSSSEENAPTTILHNPTFTSTSTYNKTQKSKKNKETKEQTSRTADSSIQVGLINNKHRMPMPSPSELQQIAQQQATQTAKIAFGDSGLSIVNDSILSNLLLDEPKNKK